MVGRGCCRELTIVERGSAGNGVQNCGMPPEADATGGSGGGGGRVEIILSQKEGDSSKLGDGSGGGAIIPSCVSKLTTPWRLTLLLRSSHDAHKL